MGTLHLLWETDAWHSYDSRVLLGVFTSEENLLDAIRTLVRKELEEDINHFNSFEEGEEPTEEELKAMTEDELYDLYEEITDPILDEFCRNGQTQSFSVNWDSTEVEADQLDENGIR